MNWRISPLGDRALVAEWTAGAADESWVQVGAAAQWLRQENVPWIIDLVPAYTSVTIVYDPVRAWQTLASSSGMTIYEMASETVKELLGTAALGVRQETKHFDVPVCYGGEYGPDLEESAERSGQRVEHFVTAHAAVEYTVALVGFVPGFPYLAGLPPQLAQPRRHNPRSRVPAGSIAIGGGQTGIYPLDVPGGWQLIGRTPLQLFEAARPEPALLCAGDRIRFIPINEEQFLAMKAEAARRGEG